LIEPVNVALGLAALSAVLSVIATYLAVSDRDLLRALIFSALQSTAYAIIFLVLMAPDIVLVYVPVAVGIYPAVVLALIKRVGRFEGGEGGE